MDLIANNYILLLILAGTLFVLSLYIRIKKAKTRKDKAIYTVYTVLTTLIFLSIILLQFFNN